MPFKNGELGLTTWWGKNGYQYMFNRDPFPRDPAVLVYLPGSAAEGKGHAFSPMDISLDFPLFHVSDSNARR